MELQRFEDLPELPDDRAIPEKQRPELEEVRSLRKYKLPNYPMFIGRDKKAGICIPVGAVSRKHAKVFEREGIFYVQDLGSINGTYLNDKRILDPVELKDGDRIKVSVTKEFPKGVREFTFRYNITPEKASEESERDLLLKETGIGIVRADTDAKKVLLRHCIFKVSKQNILSVLKSDDAKRVALTKIHLGHKLIQFQSLQAFKVKDILNFSIEHPKLPETLKLTIKISRVSEVAQKVQEHETEIVKFLEKHIKIYENIITLSPLICYITSQVKE